MCLSLFFAAPGVGSPVSAYLNRVDPVENRPRYWRSYGMIGIIEA
jgi:hypothetical protein